MALDEINKLCFALRETQSICYSVDIKMQDEDDLDVDDSPPFEPLYELSEKVREANLALETQEAPPEDPPKPPKVKFKTEVTEFEFWDSEDEWSGDGLLTSTKEEDAASVLVSDDDVEVELMPLEEDVRLGFPHGAALHEASGESDDDEPVRPAVGPSSVADDGPVSSISDELSLALDLRDSDDDEVPATAAPKVAPPTKAPKPRPWTAPSGRSQDAPQRHSCTGRWAGAAHLPHYNGLRSEYGLSKEQLDERKRMRQELAAERRNAAQQQQLQLEERRDENERVFRAWTARKQAEKFFYGSKQHDAKDKKLQNLTSEARRIEAQISYDQWLRRKRQERRNRTSKNHNKWKSKDLASFFGCMDQHTQRTFRIYLGIRK